MSKHRKEGETEVADTDDHRARADEPVTVTNVVSFATRARTCKPPTRVVIMPKSDDPDPGPGAA